MTTKNQRPILQAAAVLGAAFLLVRFGISGIRSRNPNQDPNFLSQHLDLLPGFVRRAAVEDLRTERP